MKGKLYGIGVGPGDPELMTVKAARIVGEADIIITPKTEKKDGSVALNIAKPYIQDHTEIVPVVFPMVLDDNAQAAGWEEARKVILGYLEAGKNVVFLTLGDPMFYSTYMYVYRLIENTGFEIETIPGVTAFCAIGSHLGYPIVEKEEVLAIVPATAPKEKIDKVLAVADDAVIMKVYRNFHEVQETLKKHDMADDAVMISRVGLDGEEVYRGLDKLPADLKLNYLSTVLAKRKDR
ncbi:precorrin-2 C(20)-methyltransferase [Veillonella criceti]|uniref:Cobalt-precorrin-2 C(20)-methyltransferase n=1 Tax=Veillonella criceti TaxID=103891 RepID=A0A380NGA0_9FIRM|nr:precorrin-2 C(20)-methyltransferase [Veillonella criceti]SUP39590.1 Cobalt-precorrin-2 C(20)-methyltransferase [Veillonella criceti]